MSWQSQSAVEVALDPCKAAAFRALTHLRVLSAALLPARSHSIVFSPLLIAGRLVLHCYLLHQRAQPKDGWVERAGRARGGRLKTLFSCELGTSGAGVLHCGLV